MKCILIFLTLASSFAHAVDLPPVTEGTKVVDFVYQDFGKFFRDNGNSNAILRFTRRPNANVVEVFLADGKGPPREDEATGRRLDGMPQMTRVKPMRLLIKVSLTPTATDSSTYEIADVETDERGSVFVKGGTVNFAGSTPGFDLGSTNVIEVRETPGDAKLFSLMYIEAYVPPGCEANAT